jgi:hypothetical protein
MARVGGRRELQQGRAAELRGLADKIAARHQIDLRVLGGPDRRRAVSAARRALARAAAVERGIRPVEVSRYLGLSRAAITAQLRTLGLVLQNLGAPLADDGSVPTHR